MLKTINSLFSLFAEFDLSSRPAVVAAVSGGSDSTALMLLLQQHLRDHAPATRLLAVTVDHALRASSADEAEAVAELCVANDIEHRILRWTDPKPATGIPAEAREARYRLLAQAAREAGSDLVFTGHTANDQAETVLMRKARSEGLGLAGMAVATLYEGTVWLCRPMLLERRRLLQEYLRWRGVPWIEDATNVDQRFERPRVRARLQAGPPPRKTPELHSDPIWDDIFASPGSSDKRSRNPDEIASLLGLARQTRQARQALSGRAAALITALVRQAMPGLLHIDPSFARSPDQDGALRALQVVLATVGGCAFLPPEDQTRTLLARLAEPPFRGTLSRTLVAARRDGVWLARETRDLPQIQLAKDGAIWDGRYRLRVENNADGMQIAAGHSGAGRASDSRLPSTLVRAAEASQPVLSVAGAPLRSPLAESLSAVSLIPVVAPYARFLPVFDYEAATAAGELIGASELPHPPFVG